VERDQRSRYVCLLRNVNAVLQLAQLMKPEGGLGERGINLARGVPLQAGQELDAAEQALATLAPFFAPIRQAVAVAP
jgi:hypothetical protein